MPGIPDRVHEAPLPRTKITLEKCRDVITGIYCSFHYLQHVVHLNFITRTLTFVLVAATSFIYLKNIYDNHIGNHNIT